MASAADEDLTATKTEGYKPGEKKTVEEYSKLDQEDEALNRWKQSLGLGGGSGTALPVAAGDARKCVILSLALEVEGRQDITLQLEQPGSLESLKKNPFTIKEGAQYRMKANFRVQGEVLSGLKYLQVVKRMGIKDKHEEMLGSYAPSTVEKPMYTVKFRPDEAPSGMLARGHYEATSAFVDDDGHKHLEFQWSFDITKDWK